MKRFRDALSRVLDQTKAAAQENIPAGNVKNQLPGTTLPPTGNTGSGYTPGDDSVTTGKLVDDAVTFAKMQNITTDRLLGRDTAGTGDVEQIAVGGGLEFTGSTGIQRSALTGDATASAGSGTTALSTTGVSAATYGDSTHVPQIAVDAKGRITGASNVAIAAGMTNPMTTAADLIVGGVSGTPARLAKGSDSQVLTVDPTTHLLVWATPAATYTDPLTTRGDLVARGASSTTRLAIGAANRLLRSDGTDPSWGQVVEADLNLTDLTTADVSTSKHGFAPKAPNVATQYLDGTGAYSVPAGSAVDLWALIWDQLAAGSDPIDVKVTSGSYVLLMFFKGNATSGWTDATNAIHTVTAGKTLIVVYISAAQLIYADSSNRQARLQNTTDATAVVDNTAYQRGSGLPWEGDGATTSQFRQAAATKVVKMGLWNSNTTKRAMGAIAICKEV